MPDDSSGMNAEVAVRKMDSEGNVTDRSGAASPPRWAQVYVLLLHLFAGFGAWRSVEVLLSLV